MEISLAHSLILFLATLLGGIAVYLFLNIKLNALTQNNIELKITLEMERSTTAEKLSAIEKTRHQLNDTFSLLSSKALRDNNEEFLKLAKEQLKQFQLESKHELDSKHTSFESLIKPIKETLEKTEKQMHQIENERREAFGALTNHLENVSLTQNALHNETKNLVKALSRPEVRGQWGEITLKRLVELAGMVEHCDFFEQEHTAGLDNAIRPDMIVRLPAGREIIVDVKTPLDAYIRATESTNDAEQQQALKQHARSVRERVKELASKRYWTQFKNSPDFVVLFIPGDQFLNAALDKDQGLLEYALQQKVILATPTSFVALLRAVAFGWRQETLTKNAEQVRTIGEELYGRLSVFAEHLQKLGKSLSGSIQHFNNAVGSFDNRILPSAKKFSELGVNETRPIHSIDQVEKQPRAVAQQDN